MNHQNIMQQFFDQQQQQSNMNGFPGSGFQANQQIPNTYNGPTSGPNPFMGNSTFRQQNGLSRFGMSGESSDNFDMQSPAISSQTQQGFPNFMDPRMGGYDPRSRPNFDPNNMMPGMETYGGNSNYSAKMRMNEMAAMFVNPAALAAFQRQRMNMFGQGRDNDYMSPTNPFSGFNPQQTAQLIQQQRAAAYQRQVQEQLASQHLSGANRNADMSRQYSSPSATATSSSTGNGPVPDATYNQNSQDAFPSGFSPHSSRSSVPHGSDSSNSDMQSTQSIGDHRSGGSTGSQNNTMNESPLSTKYPNPPSGSSTPRMPFDQGSSSRMPFDQVSASRMPFDQGSSSRMPFDQGSSSRMPFDQGASSRMPFDQGSSTRMPFDQSSSSRMPFDQGNEAQRNAAMLAAAAVRAAAAASTRGRGGFPAPNAGGANNYPFGLRGYPTNIDQMPSPYPSQGMHSPEYGGVMSPARDIVPNPMSQSPMSQGRGTPRNGNPPPYSPMSHSNDSNMSGSGSVKGSFSNLANIAKHVSQPIKEENTPHGQNSPFEGAGVGRSVTPKSAVADDSHDKGFDANHVNNDRNAMITSGNNSMTKLSAPPTPMSTSSPAPSPFQDDIEIDNLSPSWPQTPLSPSAQKLLKSQASPKHYDQLSKVYDLIDDDEKRNFLDRYLAFMSVNGTPVTKLPVIGKQSLDLYTLFRAVCERGGIQEVMEKRRFKEILTCLNLPIGNTLAYMVKDQYMKYLHAYEIKAKDVLLKQWKNSITLSNNSTANSKQEAAVPTIALNDSFRPDMKPQINQSTNQNQMANSFHGTSSDPVSSWNQNLFPPSSITTSSIPNTSESSQYGSRLSYANQVPQTQGLPAYGQPGMPGGYGNDMPPGYGNDMPPGYPGYGGYQNPMYPRGPMQNYNSIRSNMQNENMAGSWPRGYPPRQGPPELFPEGLQRMSWNQSSQRHPMSAFSSPSFPANKSKGQMPPISRDSIEHMKYNAQQQQLKMQQFQHQQQQMQKRYNISDPSKIMPKVPRVSAAPEVKPVNVAPVQQIKREFTFPANSIEGTKPTLKKRKKLTSKELGPVEAWRIMMSLKSGLVAECTWAIDTLNILLADNNTITYFNLNQLPGLLDTLMDHYRRSLSDLFHAFGDLEIPLLPQTANGGPEAAKSTTDDKHFSDLWIGVCKNSKSSYTSNIASLAVTTDNDERLNGGKQFWEEGGGDCTSHVQTSFPTKNIALKRFPIGVPYVTKAEAEKQRKLEKLRKHKLEKLEKKRLLSLDEKNSLPDIIDNPKSPEFEYLPPESKLEPKNHFETLQNDESSDEVSTACLGVLDDLLTECEEATEEKDDPLIEKILADLEFNIPCDKKYLEDSKEFIEYLNRRLSRENRGNVVSEQCVVKQSTPFVDIVESEQCLLYRCVALSNVFRSLSFIQGNDSELASHIGLLLLSGYILLHKHEHAITDHSQFKLGLDERTVLNNAISDSEPDWWWDSIYAIRENTLVMLSNIGGHLNLSRLKEKIYGPLIQGLLHWLVCRSSESIDPMPTAPVSHALSAKKLAMETLAKMTINSANIELVISSQSNSRLEEVNDVLLKQLAKKHPIPSREFAIILLDNLAHNEQFSRVLACRKSAVRNIVKFVYEAEKNTSSYLSSGGRVQPGLNAEDICGTSISLLRRSVNILLSIAKLPCNRRALTSYTDDILALSTSQMIDTSVLALLAQVLFELDA